MSTERSGRSSRDDLFELAIANGINYDRYSKKPARDKILLALKSKGITDSDSEIHRVRALRKRLTLSALIETAKRLGVYNDSTKDDRSKLAIHIYTKDKSALEQLSKYQQTHPTRKTVSYDAEASVTLDNWVSREKAIKTAVENSLTDSTDSIATVEAFIVDGKSLRVEVKVDYPQKIVEREHSPKFPDREGTYRAYPLKKMVLTYNDETKTVQVSAHPKNTQPLIYAVSEALTGFPGAFQLRLPSSEQAVRAFTDPQVMSQLLESHVGVTEIVLRRIAIRGNVSYLHMRGENLLETITQLADSDIHIVGEGASIISQITFEIGDSGSKLSINYENGKKEKSVDLTPEEEAILNSILMSWGV